MLRITLHHSTQTVTVQLEGRLAGPWVQELETCWNTLARGWEATLRVDLTGVTFIDAAGKRCLSALYTLGAELIAADCLTSAIVAEITGAATLDKKLPVSQGTPCSE